MKMLRRKFLKMLGLGVPAAVVAPVAVKALAAEDQLIATTNTLSNRTGVLGSIDGVRFVESSQTPDLSKLGDSFKHGTINVYSGKRPIWAEDEFDGKLIGSVTVSGGDMVKFMHSGMTKL